MTIERRIHVVTGIIVLFMLIIGSILLWNSYEVKKGIDHTGTSSQIVRNAFLLRILMDEYLVHGNARPLRQWDGSYKRLGEIIRKASGSNSVDQSLLKALEREYQALSSIHSQILELATSRDQRQEVKALMDAFSGIMSVRLEELVNAAVTLHRDSQSLTLRRQKLAETFILAASLLMIGVLALNLYLIKRAVVLPLQELTATVEPSGGASAEQLVKARPKGEIGKLTETFNVVIERLKTAQEAAQSELQRLYDVLETLPVYVCLLDSDYRMPFANRYFRETFGESQGRRCHDFLFDRTEPCEICETYTVMKTRAPHHWYWTGPNGRDYDIYDFPFFDTDGSFQILEMGIDITERKQAENALQETLGELTRSNEDLQQFAYVASHDLQEPLRNVASCLQLLEKEYKNKLDADADQYIQYAVESSVRMKALIQDLLAYSRITTKGKGPERVECEKIFDRTMMNLGLAIAETGAVVTHDPLPIIYGDDTQLLQMFQNLIGNAIKFRRDEAPRIHLSAAKDKNEWVLSVKDNGIGIEAQHLERIFAIFQRLHKRSEYQGTGMGLAIVKKIVERHRGRIWVESQPGVGTSFYFTIPEKGLQI